MAQTNPFKRCLLAVASILVVLGILWAGSRWPWLTGGAVNAKSPTSEEISLYGDAIQRLNERGIDHARLIFVLSGDWTDSTECVLETYIVSDGFFVLTQRDSVSRSSRPGDPRVIRFREGVACGETENDVGEMVPILQGVGGLRWGRKPLRSPTGLLKGVEQCIEGPLSLGRRSVVFVRSSEPVPIEASDDPAEIADKVGEGAVVVFGMLEER